MSALNSNQYERLRPYLPVIRKFREAGGIEVSTEPRRVMADILFEICSEVSNLSCSGCVWNLYQNFNAFLDEFEKENL